VDTAAHPGGYRCAPVNGGGISESCVSVWSGPSRRIQNRWAFSKWALRWRPLGEIDGHFESCNERARSEDTKASPWQIDTLKPIHIAKVDVEEFLKARAQFTTDEWMDVLMQSMGFNPEMFGRRAKVLTLIRSVPYCELNYILLELGPKGTGKSHIYAEFSPHGMLISGSEVAAPKLCVSNASGKIGLVGYWDCVCFDEFAGKDKKVDKALVDIMKNHMANRTFSRGIEQLTGISGQPLSQSATLPLTRLSQLRVISSAIWCAHRGNS
jgi:uncharacterized protein (TIGR02688 family)